jgi:hypothetical protein
LKIIAISTIFTLFFTSHIQLKILKLIARRKLKIKNNIEYLRIVQEIKNFSQNSVYAIISANIKKNVLNIIHIKRKFSANIFLINLIFLYSFFE